MLIHVSDVCHNYQFSKVILINVTPITPKEAVYLLKTLSYVSKLFSMQTT